MKVVVTTAPMWCKRCGAERTGLNEREECPQRVRIEPNHILFHLWEVK